MKTSAVVFSSILVGATIGFGSSAVELGWFGSSQNIEQLLSVSRDARQPDLAPAGAPQPRTVVDRPEYDFGSMDRGTKKTHEFVFTNEGDAPLKLVAGDTTCKCTLSKLAEDEIPPGGLAMVTLEWMAKAQGIDFRQTATILTNDPVSPRVQLTVTGWIVNAMRIEPMDFVYSSILAGTEKTAEVRLLSFTQDDFHILNHRFLRADTAKFFEISEQNIPSDELQAFQAKAGKLLRLTVKPGLPIGSFEQELEFTTNVVDKDAYVIPIRGRILGELSIVGSGWSRDRGILSLGTVDSDQGKRAQLAVYVRGEHARGIEITIGKVWPPTLQVTLGEHKEIKGGRVVRVPLTIEIPRGTPPMIHMGSQQGGLEKGGLGEIILKTNHPQTHDLRIRVRFAVGT